MKGPSFLSEELRYYESFNTEQEMYLALRQRPRDLLDFFEVAVEDEFWCEAHSTFIQLLIRWVAKSYYLDQLPLYMARRIVIAIQKHANVLKPFLYFRPSLFFTITLTVEKQEIVVNSLLFGVMSPFFHNLFKNQCFNRWRDEWSLPKIPLFIFRLVEEHILKGEIPDLWRYEQSDILLLMQQARVWSISSLVKECAGILYRYINTENAVDILLKAHRQFFSDWKQDAIKVFNQQGWGLHIVFEKEADLNVEVLDFKQETLELFDALAPWITHLAFKGQLSEESWYAELISKCPKLVGMDLSNTSQYVDQFNPLPANLMDLDVSSCAWLDFRHLRMASQLFLNLKTLSVGDNPHLNYMSWAELGRFSQLTHIDLSRSHQLTDEDLRMVVQTCFHLNELNLQECRGLTDRGVIDLIHYSRHLTKLNLSYCYQFSDRILMDIGSYAFLTHLTLVRCINLSDRGLIHLLQFCRSLKYLNVQQCEFSIKVLEQIKRNYPLLELIY